MENRPIICFDFDGTLVDPKGRIRPRDIEILTGERRALFIPATARLLHSVRAVFERNGLFVDRPIPFPLHLQNGATLYGPDEKLVRAYPFPEDVQREMIEVLERHRDVTFLLYTVNEVYVLWPTEKMLEAARGFDLNTQPFTEKSREEAFTKVAGIAETSEPVRALAEEIAQLPLELSYSSPTALEINKQGVNKGKGLVDLLEILEVDHTELVVAGDGDNDLPLFDHATASFAPHSSPKKVQSRADYVIDVDEVGIFTPILRVLGLEN